MNAGQAGGQAPGKQREGSATPIINPHAHVESGFTGRAGEFLVAAHLLRQNIEASLVNVDYGVDVEATRTTAYATSVGNISFPERYRIQVKTTRADALNLRFSSDKFTQMMEMSVNLVVVFWQDPSAPILIVFPPSLLYMMSAAELKEMEGAKAPASLLHTGDGKIVIKVFVTLGGRVFVRNRRNEFTVMTGRFDRLETTEHEWFTTPYHYATWSSDPRTLIAFPEGAK